MTAPTVDRGKLTRSQTSADWGRPAWAEIDLDAVEHNVRAIKSLIGSGVRLIAVAKANAYGHGAVPVAAAAHAAGADIIAVSCADEAIELRLGGLQCDLLILGHSPAWEAERIVAHRVTPTVISAELACALSDAAGAQMVEQPVHVKVDSGMGRFGLLPEEALPFIRWLLTLPNIRLEGVFTHFARADEPETGGTDRQFAIFRRLLSDLAAEGIRIPIRHAANTAATLENPETWLDGVRCGVALTGLYPSSGSTRRVHLRPAMALKARIARQRLLPAGSQIGYGGTWTLTEAAHVALIPMGYADGLPLALSNRGVALVAGRRVPLVGRLSMDGASLLLGQSAVASDEEVVLIGRQGGDEITAEEAASLAGTIHYELVTRIPPRLPRVYLRGGRTVLIQTLLGSRPIEPAALAGEGRD